MTIKYINPNSLYDTAPFGMSHATVDTDSGLVFVSGQVDWDKEHQISDPTMAGQAAIAMENLSLVLNKAGAALDTVLQLRIYVRGEISDHLDALIPVLAEHLAGHRPALTGIGVASLASADLLLEIEATAKLRKHDAS